MVFKKNTIRHLFPVTIDSRGKGASVKHMSTGRELPKPYQQWVLEIRSHSVHGVPFFGVTKYEQLH